MLSVAEARARMLSAVRPTDAESAPLAEAHGRTLAEPIVARIDQPPFDSSAMDGWAVRRVDTPGTLTIAGESAAGRGHDRPLGAGEAVRIFTGAPVPAGADAVILQEVASRERNAVVVPAAGKSNIRPKASDFAAGERLLEAGRRLGGAGLAIAAAAGADPVAVRARPRVVVIATGDELVPPANDPKPGEIFESVSYGLEGLITAWGGVAARRSAVGDDLEAMGAAFDEACRAGDLVVTIGGASVGDHDVVKPALARLEPQFLVEKIAVKPGKPTWFAATRAAPVLGLPGNPASALVCAHLFLRPVIDALLGRARDAEPESGAARLATALPDNGPRESYLRARVRVDDEGALVATPAPSQDSSLLKPFATANALIRLAPGQAGLVAGAIVEVIALAESSLGSRGA